MSVRTGICSSSDSVLKKTLTLTSSMDGSTLQTISVDKSPFTVAAAPLQAGRRMRKDGFTIYEPVGASVSTISYKGIRYNLVEGIQICRPTHANPANVKWVPERSQPQTAELIATFQRSSTDNIAYPDIILAIIPIYAGASANSGAAFIEQLIRTDASGVGINALLGGSTAQSYSYNVCISLTQERHIDAAIFFFPYGIELTSQAYTQFIGGGNNVTLPDYGIPGISRAGADTVYTTATGSMTSPEGRISSVPENIIPSDSKFKNSVEYFLKGPTPAGTREPTGILTTAQYKCTPFENLVDGDKVLTGEPTLADVLAARRVAVGGVPQTDTPKIELSATETGLIVFSSIIGVGLLLGGGYYLYKKISA
jgi:hypothetical protein